MTDKELDKKIAEIVKKGDKVSIFERNVLAIAIYSAPLAKRLLEADALSAKERKFEICKGKDPIDINLVNKKTLSCVYESPAREIEEHVASFEKEHSRYMTLFFYGIGNGIFLKSILGNPTHKYIVVLEPEIEILHAALSLLDFSDDLRASRLSIFQTDIATHTHYYTIFSFPGVKETAMLYNLNIYNKFYDAYMDDACKANEDIMTALIQIVNEVGNSPKDAYDGIANTVQNTPTMIESYPISNVAKARAGKNEIAIIVATGPSLAKQLPLLKKIAPFATIISVDASYPILKKHGIKPDYVTSIERVAPTAKFFDSPASEFDENIMFIVASLTHPKTVSNLKGRRVCYALRPLDFEKGYQDINYGYVGSGTSAAHLALDMAYILEHKKIVFIGQDLAFADDGKTHAAGHIYGEKEDNFNLQGEYIDVAPKYGGGGEVKTTKVWNLFRNFFETFIRSRINKDPSITAYNCTEGGARIAGTVEKPFAELVDETVKKGVLKVEPNVERLSATKRLKSLRNARKYLKSVIKFGDELEAKLKKEFLKLAKEIEKDKALVKDGKKAEINYKKLQKIANEIDQIKDGLNNREFLYGYHTICSIFLFQQDLELAKVSARPSDTPEEKKDKLFEWVSLHGMWLFNFAGLIDAQVNMLKDKSAKWLSPSEAAKYDDAFAIAKIGAKKPTAKPAKKSK